MNDNRKKPYGTDRDPAPARDDLEDRSRPTDSGVEADIPNEDVLAHVEEIEEQEAEEEEVDDDNNPYQESDEALPDDAEEAAITRHPSREGSRFDEI